MRIRAISVIGAGIAAWGVGAGILGAAEAGVQAGVQAGPQRREFTFAEALPYLQAAIYVGTDDMETPIEHPGVHACEGGVLAAKLPDPELGSAALAAIMAAVKDEAILARIEGHVVAARKSLPKGDAGGVTMRLRGFLATDPALMSSFRARLAESAREAGLRCRDCRDADPEGTWSLRWRRESFWPSHLDGAFSLREGKDGWSGAGWAETIHGNKFFFDATSIVLDGDRIRFVARERGHDYAFEGRITGGTMDGSVRWSPKDGPEQRDAFVATRRDIRLFEAGGDARGGDARGGDGPFLRAAPEEAGLPSDELARFVLLAEDARTDALAIVSDGKLVCRRSFGADPDEPLSLQSITKGISSLAVPLLIRDGTIASVDEPVSRWIPELAADERKAVTLLHVLTHSTGLEAGTTPDVNAAEDRTAHAVGAKLATTPGSTFEYNNRAMQLLPAVVRAASGEGIDDLLSRRLFEPLGLTSVRWGRDKAGHASAYSGLSMSALDLATIGALLAARGRWKDEQLIPAKWIDAIPRASEASPRMGLGWFRFGEGDDAGFVHSGDGGQYLAVIPARKLVIARLARIPPRDDESAEMQAFGSLVSHLAQSKIAP